ncbi:MAG: mandelate racemase/muconate lactonizing enzyme family protein [Planctomycetes bacterium]|nr:mandelate racemase/muconate lactonizing enzyme family protein [Planctomycetota bacterium]
MAERENEGLNRRDVLAVGAAAAGAVLLADAGKAPGAQVEDRGSAIRITAIRGLPCGPKAYVKIETNNKNIVGWGEITGLEPRVAASLAEAFRELLVDENPTRIEHLWQKIFRSHRDMRGGPFMTHTLSAIDMALWDITGKQWGVPVYRLLGGPLRETVRMYPTPRATKLGTGGPHPFSGNPGDINRLVKMVQDTRQRLGPDGTIMFDAHCAIPPAMLIQFANAIQPLDILWLEEPAVPGNIEVFKRLKRQIRIPLATGERDRTIWEMIAYLQNGAIDILQPDVGHTGGISQMRKIAALAEAYHVPLAPHNTCSELGLSASIHVSASIPLFLIQEGYLDGHIMPPGVARKSFTLDKDGNAGLPQGVGLGVEIDEAMIQKVNADPKRRFRWPTPTYADGAVRDY